MSVLLDNDDQQDNNLVSNEPLVAQDDGDDVNGNGNVNGGDNFADEIHDRQLTSSFEISSPSIPSTPEAIQIPWEPSGIWWRDMLYFVGPGKYSSFRFFLIS